MTTPRTMAGDIIDARETVRAAGVEMPEWLLSSKLTSAQTRYARPVRSTR